MTEKKAALVRDYVGHIIVAITRIEAYVEGLDCAAFVETTLVQGLNAGKARRALAAPLLCVDGIDRNRARRSSSTRRVPTAVHCARRKCWNRGEMMASGKHPLPNTKIAPDTGELLTRGVRPFVVSYKGESVTVELPGYYPAGAGDGVHVGDDVSVVDEALRGLEKKIESLPSPTR